MSYVKAFYTGNGYSLYMPDGTLIPGCLGTTISDEWVDAGSKVGESGFKTGRVTVMQEMYVEVVNEEPKKILNITDSPDEIVAIKSFASCSENTWMMSNHDSSKWIMRFDEQQAIKVNPNYPQVGKTSDGYHTFDELYAHRIALFKALCIQLMNGSSLINVWKSKLHSDGSYIEGWFIAGINTEPEKQITYHIPLSEWDTWPGDEMDIAPQWDGHGSADVLKRLSKL